MSLPNCIPGLIAEGKIRKADGDKATKAFNRHYRMLRDSMGEAGAAAEASERAIQEMEYAANLKRRQAGLQIVAQKTLDADLAARTAKGRSPHRALVDTLRGVTGAAERIERQSHDGLYDFIQKHRRNMLGEAKDKTGLNDVVDELHGRSTGNDTAASFAKAIHATFESLRLRFNRAGGDIARREDFGMAHHYDPLKVRRAGLDAFKADMLAELAPERMIDPMTGGRFTPERLEEFIDASWKNIRSGGISGDGPSGAARMLANRRSDPRHFVFKDGRAWLRIAAKYGSGNPFEAVFAHIHGMAHDIAMMEALGPNPSATWKRAMDMARGEVAQGDGVHSGVVNGTSRAERRAEKMWSYVSGDLTVPVFPDGDGLAARAGRGAVSALHGTRNLLTSALLGSSQLTAISDINTQIFARKMNGLPQVNVLLGYLKMLNPLDASHRRRAVYLGAGMRDGTRALLGIARFYGETQGPHWTQVLADDVLRVTGVNKFFEAGQRLYVDDYAAQLAEERHLAFADLPQERKDAFDRHGITADEWDVIRNAEIYREGGREWVDWHRVADHDQRISDKMQDMLLDEASLAVVEADAETHSMLRFDRPGTLAGEIGANSLQFKSFPLALMIGQARRIGDIAERHGPGAAAKYAASFVVGMTMFGAMTIQLRQIAKGQDMRPMDTPEFWIDALMQSGGLGIFSDVYGAVSEDRVNGLAKLAAGPVVQFVDEANKSIKSIVPKDAEGRRDWGGEYDYGDMVKLMRRYTPGTNIFYTRAATDRLIWDELDERINKDHDADQARLIEHAQEQGTPYFYEPGEAVPHRAPQMGTAPTQ